MTYAGPPGKDELVDSWLTVGIVYFALSANGSSSSFSAIDSAHPPRRGFARKPPQNFCSAQASSPGKPTAARSSTRWNDGSPAFTIGGRTGWLSASLFAQCSRKRPVPFSDVFSHAAGFGNCGCFARDGNTTHRG